ncbi:hypothetical protein ALP43_200048 [Pseudomonas azotoformans]|nr:hypothetical protein ALP43_200048 [Pseudomonas azotoformans]
MVVIELEKHHLRDRVPIQKNLVSHTFTGVIEREHYALGGALRSQDCAGRCEVVRQAEQQFVVVPQPGLFIQARSRVLDEDSQLI